MLKQLHQLRAAVQSRVFRFSRPSTLEAYVTVAPNGQTALDVFRGEWYSRMPASSGLQAGATPLFEDARVAAALDTLGGVAGQAVLELGPLEGGHTYMLHERGAARITAVEANTRGYLKCLVVKEVFGLERAHFLCGEFVEYLKAAQAPVDLCLAVGVLYHMRNPVELLALVARSAERLVLWTHYYDAGVIAKKPPVAARFVGQSAAEYGGFRHTLYRHQYNTDVFSRTFIGGTAAYSQWMGKDDLLAAVRHFGMEVTSIEPYVEHPHGPSLTLTAVRAR